VALPWMDCRWTLLTIGMIDMMTEGTKAMVLNYTEVDAERKEWVRKLKIKAADYFDMIVAAEDQFGRQRDFSIAKTHLQEASMWVTRGLTNPDAPDPDAPT
jgi:hypothetical protein